MVVIIFFLRKTNVGNYISYSPNRKPAPAGSDRERCNTFELADSHKAVGLTQPANARRCGISRDTHTQVIITTADSRQNEKVAISILILVMLQNYVSSYSNLFLFTHGLTAYHRLVGIVDKTPASGAKGPGFQSRLRWDFSGSSHTSDFKIGTPVATLPGAWCYRVSAGTGRPGVSVP